MTKKTHTRTSHPTPRIVFKTCERDASVVFDEVEVLTFLGERTRCAALFWKCQYLHCYICCWFFCFCMDQAFWDVLIHQWCCIAYTCTHAPIHTLVCGEKWIVISFIKLYILITLHLYLNICIRISTAEARLQFQYDVCISTYQPSREWFNR